MNNEMLLKKMNELENSLNKIDPSLINNVVDYVINPVIKIDPKIASIMLTKNSKNRTISRNKVKEHLQKMNKGEWRLNRETVKFNKDGILADGQHRLTAITLLNNQNINVELSLNLKLDDYATLDTGKSRTFSDVLSSENILNNGLLSSAIKLLYKYNNKLMYVVSEKSTSVSPIRNNSAASSFGLGKSIMIPPSSLELQEYFSDYLDLPNYIIKDKKLTPLGIVSGDMTFINYILSKIDSDLADELIGGLINGVNLEANDLILRLRNKLLQLKASKSRTDATKKISMVFKAWNNIRAGKRYNARIPIVVENGEDFTYAK